MGYTALIGHSDFAVNDCRVNRQVGEPCSYGPEATRHVVSRPADQPHPAGLDEGEDAVAIMLDLVNPAGAARRLGGGAA
jgi:hypothetical protein